MDSVVTRRTPTDSCRLANHQPASRQSDRIARVNSFLHLFRSLPKPKGVRTSSLSTCSVALPCVEFVDALSLYIDIEKRERERERGGGNKTPCVFPRSRLRFTRKAGSKVGAGSFCLEIALHWQYYRHSRWNRCRLPLEAASLKAPAGRLSYPCAHAWPRATTIQAEAPCVLATDTGTRGAQQPGTRLD